MRFPAILRAAEEGGYTVECPVIPGCFSQGETREEALRNIAEAIALALECRKEEGWELPADCDLVEIP